MSRRLVWCSTLGVLLALGASRLPAQETDAQLMERIEQLEIEVEEAYRVAVDAERRARADAERNRRPTTELQVGPLRVVAVADQAELAEELFAEVWREDFASVPASPSLERSVFTFEWWTTRPAELYVAPAVTGQDDPLVRHMVSGQNGPVVRRVEVHRLWVPTRQGLESAVRGAIWAALRDDFADGSRVREWIGGGSYTAAADAYRALAVDATPASHSCLGPDQRACFAALGMAERPTADELSDWFTPWQRQGIIRQAAQPWGVRLNRDDPAVRACLEQDELPTCDRLVVDIRWLAGSHTPREANVHLLWHAARLGGEGAWQRAIAGQDAELSAFLASVSNQDIDELVGGWRAVLAKARPAAHAGLAGSTATVLFWTLILAALAMRSTRWRLG